MMDNYVINFILIQKINWNTKIISTYDAYMNNTMCINVPMFVILLQLNNRTIKFGACHHVFVISTH